MRVLEVNVDDLNYGGVYSLVKCVISHIPERKGIDIASIEKYQKQENIVEFEKLGTNVFYIGYEGNKIIKQFVCFAKLSHLLRNNQYDCVHIHADVANKLLVSGLAAKRSKIRKIILHSHAAGVDGNNRIMKRIRHMLCRRILKYIGTDFVACSKLAAEWMFPNISEIGIINNGVDIDRFKFSEEKRASVRKRLGVGDEDILLGHVGRFAYQKNHEYLVRLMVGLRKKHVKAKLLLVGEGERKDYIRSMVEKADLKDNIIFYGATDQVNELYQAMDVFLLPSHFEGLPVVGVEAQAAGVPVIFSECITKEAKIIEQVSFLGIEEEDIDLWIYEIQNFCKYKRVDTSDVLRQRRFSIQNTVEEFYNLYTA